MGELSASRECSLGEESLAACVTFASSANALHREPPHAMLSDPKLTFPVALPQPSTAARTADRRQRFPRSARAEGMRCSFQGASLGTVPLVT